MRTHTAAEEEGPSGRPQSVAVYKAAGLTTVVTTTGVALDSDEERQQGEQEDDEVDDEEEQNAGSRNDSRGPGQRPGP